MAKVTRLTPDIPAQKSQFKTDDGKIFTSGAAALRHCCANKVPGFSIDFGKDGAPGDMRLDCSSRQLGLIERALNVFTTGEGFSTQEMREEAAALVGLIRQALRTPRG